MTMDDFSLPLGQGRHQTLPVFRRAPKATLSFVAVIIIVAGALIAHEWLRPNDRLLGAVYSGVRFGGGPMMVPLANLSANLMQRGDTALVPEALDGAAQSQSASGQTPTLGATPVGQTITIVNGLTGARQDFVVPMASTEDHRDSSDRASTEISGNDQANNVARNRARSIATGKRGTGASVKQ